MDLVSTALAPVHSAPRSAPGGPATFKLYTGSADLLLARRAGLIVTPNLDHLRLLGRSKALRRAYARADVIANDSRFLDRLAIRGAAACLPGADLAPDMLDTLAPEARVFVVGVTPPVQAFLTARYPRLVFAFADPSMGYIKRRSERRTLAATVLATRPDCVFVCTGAPQSELFAAQLKRAGCTATILCCGSALSFLAGVRRRAPAAVRLLGAEWVWRFVHERRVRSRYAADAAFLLANIAPLLALRRHGEARFGDFVLRAV